jgi:hypothetical protein
VAFELFIHLKRKVCWPYSNPTFGIACLDTRCCSKTGVTSRRERIVQLAGVGLRKRAPHREWQKVRYGEQNNQTRIGRRFLIRRRELVLR